MQHIWWVVVVGLLGACADPEAVERSQERAALAAERAELAAEKAELAAKRAEEHARLVATQVEEEAEPTAEPAKEAESQTSTTSDSSDDELEAPPPDASVEVFEQQASEAYKSSRYPEALRMCKKALDAHPGSPRATLVCALSSCRLKNSQAAQRYYANTRGAQKSMVRQQCISAGVNLR